MVRAKDSMAVCKLERTGPSQRKGAPSTKAVLQARSNVILLAMLSLFLWIGFGVIQLLRAIEDEAPEIMNILCLPISVGLAVLLMVEANVLYFHSVKYIPICAMLDIILTVAISIVVVIQVIKDGINEWDSLVPGILAIIADLAFLIRGYIYLAYIHKRLSAKKTDFSLAGTSAKSFNEGLLQSLTPENMPKRDEHIKNSLDQLEWRDKQISSEQEESDGNKQSDNQPYFSKEVA